MNGKMHDMNLKKILFVTSVYPSEDRPNYCIYLEQMAQAIIRRNMGYAVEVLVLTVGNKTELKTEVFHNIAVHRWTFRFNKIKQKLLVGSSIKKELKRFGWGMYDCIHLHIVQTIFFENIVEVSHVCAIPIVCHIHGLNSFEEFQFTKNKKHRLLREGFVKREKKLKEKTLKQVNLIIGVSELTCESIKCRISNVPIRRIYNGVDTQRFLPKNKERTNVVFTIVAVGNLQEWKGQEYIIQAVKLLQEEDIFCCLKLVGIGPDEDYLRNMARDLGVENQVMFLGEQKYDDVVSIMQEADAFCLPSFFEAFGCVFLEAMSVGTSVIACKDDNGIAEVIEHGKNGLLVPKRDAMAIAEAVKYLIDTPAEKQRIESEGKKIAHTYTWDKFAIEMINEYDRILNEFE
jgi:glycosyltransferase involved in cell wall biosynthesis